MKEVKYSEIQGISIPVRGNSQFKGPEIRTCLKLQRQLVQSYMKVSLWLLNGGQTIHRQDIKGTGGRVIWVRSDYNSDYVVAMEVMQSGNIMDKIQRKSQKIS